MQAHLFMRLGVIALLSLSGLAAGCSGSGNQVGGPPVDGEDGGGSNNAAPGEDAGGSGGENNPGADGGEAEDAGEETPDVGEETPDAGEETPDAGEETPDAGEETPDAGEEPDGGGEACVPSTEVCDGVDNDCDGQVDERSPDLCDRVENAVGQCEAGACRYTCAAGFVDTDGGLNTPQDTNGCECQSQGAEMCDGLDNDCDGAADADDLDFPLTAACPAPGVASRACEAGACVYTCPPSLVNLDDDWSNGCECALTAGGVERCDGIDNDCDGAVDDLDDSFNLNAACAAPNVGTRACLSGACVYACAPGTVDLDGDIASNGCECTIEAEVCDGRDNDCDGLIDAQDGDFNLNMACDAPAVATRACQGGACVYTCAPGTVNLDGEWSNGCECALTAGGVEICDGVDNDCDGLVDSQDSSFNLNTSCAAPNVGTRACQGGACVYSCAPGTVDLDGNIASNGCECTVQPEVCDGVDNDCDRIIDTRDGDFVVVPCDEQRGICAGLNELCLDGVSEACTEDFYRAADPRFTSFALEDDLTCDTIDENCDGDDGGPAYPGGNRNCCPSNAAPRYLGTLAPNRHQLHPTLTADPQEQRFLIAWADVANPDAFTNGDLIRYVQTDRQGNTLASGSIDLAGAAATRPELVRTSAGHAISWLWTTSGATPTTTLAAAFLDASLVRGSTIFVETNSGHPLLDPSIALSSSGASVSWIRRNSCPGLTHPNTSCARRAQITTASSQPSNREDLTVSTASPRLAAATSSEGDATRTLTAWVEGPANGVRSIRVSSTQGAAANINLTAHNGAYADPHPQLIELDDRYLLIYEDYYAAGQFTVAGIGLRIASLQKGNLAVLSGTGNSLTITQSNAVISTPLTHPRIAALSTDASGRHEIALLYLSGSSVLGYRRVTLGGGVAATATAQRTLLTNVQTFSDPPMDLAPLPGVGSALVVSYRAQGSAQLRAELHLLNRDGDPIFCSAR